MMPIIDLVVLTRDESPLRADVQQAIDQQQDVQLVVHRVVGAPRDAEHRWETICRARNIGKRSGRSQWLMFLDDDVVLSPNCVRQLFDALQHDRRYGAFAADYLGDQRSGDYQHVSMGATLFRRGALERFRFRWKPNRCECQCCCDDLRAQGIGITYLSGTEARHLKSETSPADFHTHKLTEQSSQPVHGQPYPSQTRQDLPVDDKLVKDVPVARGPVASGPGDGLPGHVMVAFDRRHMFRFRGQFLKSLRAHDNWERVTVVGYGLFPSEINLLSRLNNVQVIALPVNGVMPPIRRLCDFQAIVSELPPATPVAYWDAGDVFFQSNLGPLWQKVRAHPDRILACREPKSYPYNPAVKAWTLSIRAPWARQRAFELLSSRPFLNSGFAAGTAQSMLDYLREADRLIHSEEMLGTTDWGDQAALNLYCHSDPNRWMEIAEGWNYCIHDRKWEIRIRPDGHITSIKGVPIYAAHGNARSLPQLAISRQFP